MFCCSFVRQLSSQRQLCTFNSNTHAIPNTGITLYHTPGHTRGSICVYAARQSALFVGDACMLLPPVCCGGRDAQLQGPFAASTINPAEVRFVAIFSFLGAVFFFRVVPLSLNLYSGTLVVLQSVFHAKELFLKSSFGWFG